MYGGYKTEIVNSRAIEFTIYALIHFVISLFSQVEMSDSRRHQRKVFVEMEKLLTPDIMQKLGNAINVPAQIRETTKDKPIEFLSSLKELGPI